MLEKLKQYVAYIIAFAVLLLCFSTCVESAAKRISGEVSILDRNFQKKLQEADAKSLKTTYIVDSLHKVNSEKDKKILSLKKENAKLDIKVADLEKKKNEQVVKVKSFTYKQSEQFIADRYNAPKSVTSSEAGVTLSNDVPNKIIAEVVEKDFLSEKVKFTEGKVENLELENTLLGEKVKSKDVEIATINDLSKDKDEVIDIAKELNDKQKKENKRLKTVGTVSKFLIVAAAVIGILIAK